MSDENPEAPAGPEAIAALIDSEEFQALCNYRPPFNLIRALGIQHKEHPHSNFLAFLLDPNESHGLGKDFLLWLLNKVESTLAEEVKSIEPKDIRVYREFASIDVLVECGADGPVIGIEVKIWAVEQPDQIKRYQDTLAKRFGARTKRMLYLTLSGAESDTQDPDSNVKCHPVPWSFILDEDMPSAKGEQALFVSQFKEHIKFMINDDPKLHEAVAALFEDPVRARAIRRAMKIRKGLFNKVVAEKLQRRIKKVYRLETEGKLSGSKELQLEIKDEAWNVAPIVFVFYDYPTDQDFPTGMHVFLNIQHPGFREDAWLDAMRDVFGANVRSLQRPGQWWEGWRLALPADGTDKREFGWKIKDESFGDCWIDDATNCFGEAFEQLRPVVERYAAARNRDDSGGTY